MLFFEDTRLRLTERLASKGRAAVLPGGTSDAHR
jgi:hypothetical protein